MPAFKLSKLLRRDPARPSLKARAAALKAQAARVVDRKPDAVEPDPVHAVIAASRQADATLAAFERDTLLKAIPDQPERESALNEESEAARKAVWATVPTTPAGRRALAAFVGCHAQQLYGPSWRAVALRSPLGDALLSLTAAIEAEHAVPRTDPCLLTLGASFAVAETFDLSGLSLDEHARRVEVADTFGSFRDDALRLAKTPAPDAELLAFEAEFVAADAAHIAACDARTAAAEAYAAPPMPPELHQTGLDILAFDMPRTGSRPIGDGRRVMLPYGQDEVAELRASPRTGVYLGGGEGELQPDGIGRRRINKQGQARAEQVIAAWDRWQAEVAAARAAVRLPELEMVRDALLGPRDAALTMIRDTPARSVVGLGVKARAAISMGALGSPDEARQMAARLGVADYDGLLHVLAAEAADLAASGSSDR